MWLRHENQPISRNVRQSKKFTYIMQTVTNISFITPSHDSHGIDNSFNISFGQFNQIKSLVDHDPL